MKKLSVVFVFALFAGATAFAGECKLVKPIAYGGDLLKDGLSLYEVKTSIAPRFSRPEDYDPSRNSLELSLFNLQWNDNSTGYLGINLGVTGKLGSVGFAQNYSGSFHLSGEYQEINGVKTYWTQLVSRYTEPQHAKNDAIEEAQVTVKGGEILSIMLSIPIFKVWKTEGYVDYLAFTGEHQTLCIVDAK